MQLVTRDLDELRERLTRRHPLQVFQIRHPEQIMLDGNLRTVDGYLLTFPALHQLCYRLSAGLVAVMTGLLRDHTTTRRHIGAAPHVAAKVFNEIARSRFAALRDRYMLLDPGEQQLVGSFGRRPILRPNVKFLDDCLAHVDGWEFYAADLQDRELSLFFCREKLTFRSPDGDVRTFHRGLMFRGQESSRCALRTATGWLRRKTCVMGELRKFLPRGAGTAFNCDAVVSAAFAAESRRILRLPSVATASQQFGDLCRDALFGQIKSPEQYKMRVKQLKLQLELRMTADVSALVLARVIRAPMAETSTPYLLGLELHSPTLWPVAQARRWYHLFEALLYVQQHPQCSSVDRWMLGRVAHDLLVGKRKLNFKKGKES